MFGILLVMTRNDSADIVLRLIYTEARDIYGVDGRIMSNDTKMEMGRHFQAPKSIALVKPRTIKAMASEGSVRIRSQWRVREILRRIDRRDHPASTSTSKRIRYSYLSLFIDDAVRPANYYSREEGPDNHPTSSIERH